MKKFITSDLGGHPIYMEDLEFLQEQIRELAEAAFGYCDPAIVTVLNGCEVTVSGDGYTITVTEGWAVYDNEFYYIPAQEATGSAGEVAKWRIAEAYDSRGLKTFADPAVGNKNTYLVRTLSLDFYPVISDGILFSDTVIYGSNLAWQEASVNSPYTGTFKYRVTREKKLEILGTIGLASSNFSTAIFVFDEDYWPLTEQALPVAITNMGAAAKITLKTNGEFTYTGYPGQIPYSIYFSHTFILNE